MSKPIILKALPIILLAILCLILGGIIIAQNVGNDYIPTMADAEDSASDTTSPAEPEETLPPETEPEETEPEETEPVVLASEGLEFTSLGDGTSYVSGAGSCRDSFIIIPEYSPFGERVVGIGNYAFRNSRFVNCVELNENIRFVGAYAFYGTGLVNVNIPANMEQIGDYAFCNCPSLENITVEVENRLYADIGGVLYSKDYSTLVCYPEGKRENSISLPLELAEIKTMAFYNCDMIKVVNYQGSLSSYRRIQIGAGNEIIENAVVTFVSDNTNFDK